MKKENKINSYPMSELVVLMEEFFDRGKKVSITARGNSMRPFLRDLRDEIVLVPYRSEPLCVGDVVLYKRKNGAYVLHRIADCPDDGTYTLLGDAQLTEEPGITPDCIIARADSFVIKGKRVGQNSLKYRFFARFWIKTRFWRRVYLKLRSVISKLKKY